MCKYRYVTHIIIDMYIIIDRIQIIIDTYHRDTEPSFSPHLLLTSKVRAKRAKSWPEITRSCSHGTQKGRFPGYNPALASA